MRNDSALGQPLDARATNLLSTDTGGVKGSFSGRHNGLRDCIYDEAIRAGCAAHGGCAVSDFNGEKKRNPGFFGSNLVL